MQHSETCGACKTPFSDPEFIGMQKRDLKPEEEVLMSTSKRYMDVGKAILYYKADEVGVEQGVAYVFAEYKSWSYTGFYYYATVDFSDGVMLGKVAVAADYTKSPRLSKEKHMEFTVNGGEVCGAFLCYTMVYGEQQVAERGFWSAGGQKFVGLHEMYDWISVGYSQEYMLVKRATYKEDGSGELTDGEHIFRSETDSNSVVFAHYKDGLLHGKWASHKNIPQGIGPSEERNYKNGKLHGMRTIYKASDIPGTPSVAIREMMYKDGKLHGTSYIYKPVYAVYASGVPQILAEVNYTNGAPAGVQRAYNGGRLCEETMLAADGSGILDGVCTYYYADGALYQRATFKMGVLDGFLRFYDARSVERVRILMKNGRPKEGSKAMYYDASGAVEEERKVEFGAFLADFLEEGAIVRQNATLSADGLGYPVYVQLRELAPAPEREQELEDNCCCGMCYRSSRFDDYDSDDDYDRDNYYERRYRRGYYD